jgi:hypothetical protein
MKPALARLLLGTLVTGALLLPADLLAREKHGAKVVVTRLDGSQAAGELIAVKPDSLLLSSAAGTNETVGMTDIKTVRIVRRSRALPLALIGLVTAAAASKEGRTIS